MADAGSVAGVVADRIFCGAVDVAQRERLELARWEGRVGGESGRREGARERGCQIIEMTRGKDTALAFRDVRADSFSISSRVHADQSQKLIAAGADCCTRHK